MPTPEELLAPIPGDNPSGAHLRYDPIYDRIKDVRRDDPLQDPPVRADWRQVIELSGSALAKKSKDLQLAAWYTEGLLQRDGLSGLRHGLELIQQLLERYWDTIHPEIDEDGDAEMRAAPLAWVGSYLELPIRLAPLDKNGHSYAAYRESRAVPTEQDAESDDEARQRRDAAIKEGRLDPETFEKGFAATPKAWYKQLVADIDACLELLSALDGFGSERFGEAAPSYKTMRDVLQEVRVSAAQLLARKLELEPDPVEETPIEVGGGADAAGSEAVDGQVSAVPTSREDAAKRVAAAARYLRAQAPGDPAPFLLLRGLRWGELRAEGGALNPRLLAAPPTEVRTRLKGLLLDGRWPELLEAAEEVMATPFGRGWLDLQRYVLTTCAALGGKYEVAANAIRGALRTLLRDIPELIDATLMDDSPTANAETRGWLRDQGIIGADAADEGAGESGEKAVPAESLDRMLRQLGTAQPQRAIELLMRAASQEKSERARFLRRAQAAGLMVEIGMEAVAMPLLQEMAERIERHQLEEWEAGETVARALGLLYRCMMRMDYDSSAREALYLRVCRLDPLQAMHFVESNGDEQSGE